MEAKPRPLHLLLELYLLLFRKFNEVGSKLPVLSYFEGNFGSLSLKYFLCPCLLIMQIQVCHFCSVKLQCQQNFMDNMQVPCILGVNLSDVDLLEFLHQLADTDGSSTMPPSVSRILNSKACRGMCNYCAHGRPTTAPLVNLEALHGQIAKMQVRDDEGRELWHGLCRQGVSLERASLRLRAAADEKRN
ncbi:DNA mismatch repair protein MLH3 isoform X2 [Gossypium australe]|uniref:DNA mismatch repair protein MLH3 isoform X2 n=1 Tax=Gossypium australe TaxID=47621 RepID=A0A5B6UK76_9ROSI|nr:DNA mismatch repair protein MLH3 isoform X2 [Gossypium australe]